MSQSQQLSNAGYRLEAENSSDMAYVVQQTLVIYRFIVLSINRSLVLSLCFLR